MARTTASGALWFAASVLAWVLFSLSFPVDPVFGILNSVLGVQCLFLIFCGSRSPYSLLQVFALASFVLLALVPRVEASAGITYWGGSASVFNFYPFATLLSFISLVFFWLCWRLQQNRPATAQVRREAPGASGPAAVMVASLAALVIFAYNGFSYWSVLFRGGSDDVARVSLSSSIWLVYAVILYPIPSITLVVYLLNGRGNYLVLAILFLLVLLFNPPTGMPRFQAALLYLAIWIAVAPRVVSRRHVVAWSLFVGLFALFPVLDLFRFYTDTIELRFGFGWIADGHFDSMQNFARAVEGGFVSWGWQLVGVYGFLVPRSFWPEKPVGSGQQVAGIADLEFDNIAMNILGEGYVNFGVLGVLLFAGVLGYLFGKLDARFWRGSYDGRLLEPVYLFLIGGTFFLVRGDLMSSFAFISATVVSTFIVRLLVNLELTFRFRKKFTVERVE